MKFRAALIVSLLLLKMAYGQSDNMVHVKAFPGNDVGTKTANAMRTCMADAPCILVIDASLARLPGGTMPALCANCSLADYRGGGPAMQGSQVRFSAIGSVLYADQFAGTNCGAKVNAASAALNGPGEIWVNQNCGTTWTTAVTITANHQILRFVQGGTYTSSAAITISGVGSGILGPGPTRSAGSGANTPAVMIQEANRANLPALVVLSGAVSWIQGIGLDGNKTNNPSLGMGLLISKAGGVHANQITVQNFQGDGIQVLSTTNTLNNESDAFKASDFLSYNNNGDGLHCVATNDIFLSGNFEIENNGSQGVELTDCSAARISNGDISASSADNLHITVTTATTNGANNINILNMQFADAGSHDISMNGWDAAAGAIEGTSNTFANNHFIGSAAVADNTNPSVLLQDTSNNVFTANTVASVSGRRWKWILQDAAVSSGTVGENVITGNQTYAGSAAGTGAGSPTGGLSVLSGDVVGVNIFFGCAVAGQNIVLANSQALNFYGNDGTIYPIATVDNSNNVIVEQPNASLLLYRRVSGINVDQCGTGGCKFNVPVSIGAGAAIHSSNALPQVGTPTVGQVSCIKSSGPPVIIGYCSTQPTTNGSCTCN